MCTDLPAGWTARPATHDDVPAILAVMHASDIVAVGEPDSSAEDIEETLDGRNTESVVALDPAGQVRAFAALWNPNRSEREDIDLYHHPDDGLPAVRGLLDWCLRTSARRAGAWGLPALSARCPAVPTETGLIGELRGAGFHFLKRYARMRVDLPTPGDTRLPDGVSIRPFDPDDEVDRDVLFHIIRSAFADTPDFITDTYDAWWDRVHRQSSIAWDEWWLAFADGTPVGVLRSSNQSLDRNEGWVKSLAVLRGYRGRGIGRALLATAFARYAAKGRATAGLGVDLTNPTGAYELYRSVGMTPAFEVDLYERTVAPA
jgi:ribosomal protein S18 acetylase RimI-like enzyme